MEWFATYRMLIASCYSLNKKRMPHKNTLILVFISSIWKRISKIRDMGFMRNILIYLTLKEIAKQSHGLQYTTSSSRGYFLDLLLRPVPKLSVVTAIFQPLQITSWGFRSSFPWDNFMHKYIINLIERGRGIKQCYDVGFDPYLL